MINESALRSTVAAVYEYLKSNKQDLIELQIENVALKHMLQDISGDKFLPLYERYRAEAEGRVFGGASALISRLDQAIQEIRNGGIF